MKISIIVPVYYNCENLPDFFEFLETHILTQTSYEPEVIFVDDGSGDDSYSFLCDAEEKYEQVKVIRLSRNFGSHAAIFAGLQECSGDCATIIAADLQEPPDLINRMIAKWQEGYKVVLATRKDRKDRRSDVFFANLYYKMVQKFALNNMPTGGFDSFLVDRQVIDVLNVLEEKNSSLPGQILWTGFRTGRVDYTRLERKKGKSRWTFSKKIKLFVDTFVGFSYSPIRFMSVFGFALSFLSLLMAALFLLNKLIFNVQVAGWTSIMILLTFFSGIQIVMLGIIGEYVWRAYDAGRNRPIYIVEEKRGFDKADGS